MSHLDLKIKKKQKKILIHLNKKIQTIRKIYIIQKYIWKLLKIRQTY